MLSYAIVLHAIACIARFMRFCVVHYSVAKMKKLVLSLLLFASSSSFACTFESFEAPHLREIINADGGYRLTDNQCAFLNKNRLALDVSGEATVLAGVSVAWAIVRVRDATTGQVSDNHRYSTNVNAGTPSQDVAQQLFVNSVRDAIRTYDFEKGARQVESYRQVRTRK